MLYDFVKMHKDKIHISLVLKNNFPCATDAVYDTGYYVLLWREKGYSNKNAEYLRTFKVSSFDKKTKDLVHIVHQQNNKSYPF